MVNCCSSISNVADMCVGEITVTGASGHAKLTRSTSAPNATGGRRNLPRNKEATNNNMTRYKTELCNPFEENGHCKYGDKCQFAHGKHELRSIVRHPKYKTSPCRTFHTTGLCEYGSRCHFIHGELNKSVPNVNVVAVPCLVASQGNVANGYGSSACHFIQDEPSKSVSDVNVVAVPCSVASQGNAVSVYGSSSACHFVQDEPSKSVPDVNAAAVSCPVATHANGASVYGSSSGCHFVQDESNKSVPDLNVSTSPPVGLYSKFVSCSNNSSSYVSSAGTSLASSSSWENSCETTPSASPPIIVPDNSGYESGLLFGGINMSMTAFPLSSF